MRYMVVIFLWNVTDQAYIEKRLEFTSDKDAFNLYTSLVAGFKYESGYCDHAIYSYVEMYNVAEEVLLYSSQKKNKKEN